jgi:hypothetical protein
VRTHSLSKKRFFGRNFVFLFSFFFSFRLFWQINKLCSWCCEQSIRCQILSSFDFDSFLVLKWINYPREWLAKKSEFLREKKEEENEHFCHQVPNHEQVDLLGGFRQLPRLQLQQQQLLDRARCDWHLPACPVLADLVAGSQKKINLFPIQLAIGKFEQKPKFTAEDSKSS